MNEYDKLLDMKNRIKKLCIETLDDDKAMSGEHLLADDILEIINEY